MGDLMFNGFAAWLMSLVVRSCQQALEQLTSVLESSTTVSFDSGWWVQPTSQALLRSVSLLAAAMMVGFLLLAVLQGLLAGESSGSLRALLVETPISVLGMVAVTAVAGGLLRLTDAASAALIGDGGGAAGRLLITMADPINSTGPVAGLMVALMALATLLVWVELVVRESLIYLLVAFSPLLLAARVWPAARPVWRKAVETGLALIFSKLVIALALAVGAAALGGSPPGEVDLSGLLAGATTMGTAAFTPFALLRLVPVVEAALAGQGISRSPARGLMSAMQTAYYARAFMGRGGGHSASGGQQQAASPGGGPDLSGGGSSDPPTLPMAPGPTPGQPSGARSRPVRPAGTGGASAAAPEPPAPAQAPATPRTISPSSAPMHEPLAAPVASDDATSASREVVAGPQDTGSSPVVSAGLAAAAEQRAPAAATGAPATDTSEIVASATRRRQVRPLGVPAPARRPPTRPGPPRPYTPRPPQAPGPVPLRRVPPPVAATRGEQP